MSIRPIKRLAKAKPTLEGAGVHLRRAFGFGNTSDFDPFLLLDDFRNDIPGGLSGRLPVASAPRHRDHHLCPGRNRRARRQHGQPRRHRRRRRPVDDGRAAGSSTRRCPRATTRAGCTGSSCGRTCPSSLKMTAPRYQEVKAADIPEITDDDGTHVRVVCGSFWGKTRPGGRDRRRPDLPRCLGAAGQAEDPSGRDHPPRLRLRLRRGREVLQRLGPLGGADRRSRMGRHRRLPRRRTTARWSSSTAATRSRCRPATTASGSSWSRASRSRSPWPGTARS